MADSVSNVKPSGSEDPILTDALQLCGAVRSGGTNKFDYLAGTVIHTRSHAATIITLTAWTSRRPAPCRLVQVEPTQ
jgi:hypothetical protein